MKAEDNVKKLYKHAHIREDDYYYVYVYHKSCDDPKCCPKVERFVSIATTTGRKAWEAAWKIIQWKMLQQLEQQ
jgi:hypothetical protein